MLKCFFSRLISQFISLILFVYQKYTLILELLLMIAILEISGYALVLSYHPSNNKREGVCIYYKSFLPLRVFSVQYLKESIFFELKIDDKTCNFLSLYRSPSQSQGVIETFTENLELNLENLVQRKICNW